MMEWLQTNSTALSVIINMAMVVIWLVYLQIFYMMYARQRRSKIVINKAAGSSHKSHCFVSNMSAETIYLDSVCVTLNNGDDTWIAYVTDFEDILTEDTDKSVKSMTHLGPMKSGNFYDLGSFQDIIHCAQKVSDAPKNILDQDSFSMVIKIIGIYGSEKLPVAAQREFTCNNGSIEPMKVETYQIRSYWQRRKISKELRQTYQS